MRSVECEVSSLECEECSVQCEVWSVEGRTRSGQGVGELQVIYLWETSAAGLPGSMLFVYIIYTQYNYIQVYSTQRIEKLPYASCNLSLPHHGWVNS